LIEAERLAAVSRDHRADDTDHDGDDDAARIGAGRDETRKQADDEADNQNSDDRHDASS
jgi:hypothetical protein